MFIEVLCIYIISLREGSSLHICMSLGLYMNLHYRFEFIYESSYSNICLLFSPVYRKYESNYEISILVSI